jgi:hypothetical protein
MQADDMTPDPFAEFIAACADDGSSADLLDHCCDELPDTTTDEE